MGCDTYRFPDGSVAIVCSRGRRTKRCACGRPGAFLCDHPTGQGKRTCSRPLCDRCTTKAGPDRDLCREHAPQVATRPAVALVAWTARVSYAGPDRLDVTRKSAGPEGLPFAPSWRILAPVLVDRTAGRLTDMLWRDYVSAYTAEMRSSYRAQRAAWDALLARETATLVCYCANPERCHRAILAGILVKLGAAYRGERAEASRQLALGGQGR